MYTVSTNKPKMAYSCNAFPREIQERDGAMANGLTLTNKIATKS